MNSNNGDDYQTLCAYCFDVLQGHLFKEKDIKIEFPAAFKDKSYPIFVTWTTGVDKDLRGCIGTFESEKLETNLPRYALIAALKDSRFSPINQKELPTLNVGVSLLTNFEECKDPLDWQVGTHGIEIDFKYKGREFGATFLPEVAEEENWDQKTTLLYLVRKSGYNGKLEEIYKDIHTKRYQSTKSFMSFDEYKKLRNI